MTDEMRKNMDEARAQLAQSDEAIRQSQENRRIAGERRSGIASRGNIPAPARGTAPQMFSGAQAEEHYRTQEQLAKDSATADERTQIGPRTFRDSDGTTWTMKTESDPNWGEYDYLEDGMGNRRSVEGDGFWTEGVGEMTETTRYDETGKKRLAATQARIQQQEKKGIANAIDARYWQDYDAINDRVKRGEISVFEAKALHDELLEKRDAKIRRETGVDLAFQRAQQQQADDERRMTEMKDRMGQTTYTLFKAMDRTRDPSLSDSERAAAMQVAGEAAMQMGQDFLENRFGPNSGYRPQVRVFNDVNPATGMKEIAFSVTFVDENGKPVADPSTGQAMEISLDTPRVKRALTDHYGFEEIETYETDKNGETRVAGRVFGQRGTGDNVTDNQSFEDIEVGDGIYGGRKSAATLASEADEQRKQELHESKLKTDAARRKALGAQAGRTVAQMENDRKRTAAAVAYDEARTKVVNDGNLRAEEQSKKLAELMEERIAKESALADKAAADAALAEIEAEIRGDPAIKDAEKKIVLEKLEAARETHRLRAAQAKNAEAKGSDSDDEQDPDNDRPPLA